MLMALMLVSCADDRERAKMVDGINDLEAGLYGDSIGPIDRIRAQEMIQAYENFVLAYPDDSLSAEFLFKSGEIAMGLQMPGRAIETFQRIRNNYPDFDKSAFCLFLQAFIYENQMGQFDDAKRIYQEFLELYPTHDLAEDALVSIQNMGKSLEELIQLWEQSE